MADEGEAAIRPLVEGNVERVPITELEPDRDNPRRHGGRNLAAIESSLMEHGQVAPIIARREDSTIIAGNGTWEAMRRVGFDEVDVVWLDVDERQARRLSIALNRSGELAEWDEATLARQLQEILDEGESLMNVGFDEAELDDLIAGLEGPDGTHEVSFTASDSDDGDGDGEPEAPEEFPEVGDDIDTKYQCPRCNYEWSGKPKGAG